MFVILKGKSIMGPTTKTEHVCHGFAGNLGINVQTS